MPLIPRSDLIYYSTKTWEHVASAAFRQPHADSHCRLIHGYGLTMKAVFGAYELDKNNWVIDFGGLKSFKSQIEHLFDHKLLLAEDDPNRTKIAEAVAIDYGARASADVVTVPAVGCEAFARILYDNLELWLHENKHTPRVWLESFEVMEHSGNSALVKRRSPYWMTSRYGSH